MIIYVENLIPPTKKLPEIIREFNKVAGYKANIQESTVFLYTGNRILEIDILKVISYYSIKNIKYLRINVLKRYSRPKH